MSKVLIEVKCISYFELADITLKIANGQLIKPILKFDGSGSYLLFRQYIMLFLVMAAVLIQDLKCKKYLSTKEAASDVRILIV